MAGYSFLDMAHDVLKGSEQPLTYQEIWQTAEDKGLTNRIRTRGRTPWQTMGAQLYVDVRDNPRSRFAKVGRRPAKFFLREREPELPPDVIDDESKHDEQSRGKLAEYCERDLHPLLTYFAYANPAFNRGRSIFTKTISHQKSRKSGYNEWVHPDMVGFYLPLDDWDSDVIDLNRLFGNSALRLFSFEIKKALNKGNYREAFFQAVSNSSWAHEGYLVAVHILEDDSFLSELERLASSFGIGIVRLDPMDIDSSSVLYPARSRETLDWEMISKLCDQNSDFQKFLRDVKIDTEARTIHKAEYDPVEPDIRKYIKNKLKIG